MNIHVAAETPATPPARAVVLRRVLARLEDIADGGSKKISGDGHGTLSLCLIRRKDRVYAYVNSCPHTGAPLDGGSDNFLNRDGAMIQCGFHGALFRISDGLCVWGPCIQRRLAAIPIAICDGEIILTTEAGIPVGVERRRTLR